MRLSIALFWIFFMLLFTGCRDKSRPDASARSLGITALETGLEAWRLNQKASELQSRKPPIYFADEDWHMGKKLLGFQQIPSQESVGGTYRCEVTLTLENDSGAPFQITVTYRIQTGDSISISRLEKH